MTKVDWRAKVIAASKRSWELVFALMYSALAAAPSEALDVTAREPRLSWTVPRKVLAPERRKPEAMSPAIVVLRKRTELSLPPEMTPERSTKAALPVLALLLTREMVEGAEFRTMLLVSATGLAEVTWRVVCSPRLTVEAAGSARAS